MAEVLFIDDKFIKKYTSVNGAVDTNILYPAVYLSQDKQLTSFLGTDLMVKLKTDVENDTLAGNYLTLMDDYVRKSLLWWTMVEVLPTLQYRMDNGTLAQRQSEDTIHVSDSVMKDMIDRARTNAIHYTTRMVEYLCANSSLFPEYTSNAFPDQTPNRDVNQMFNYSISAGNTAMSQPKPNKMLWQLP